MIFIDPPYWPAHGTVFSHLISDTSVSELHAFAEANGISQRAFDLDHYDVPKRLYSQLVSAGAKAVSGKDLARILLASGLRIRAKYRVKNVVTVLESRWQTLMPGHVELGSELLLRWNEPHRHYHCATHLLAVLEALDHLTERNVPRPVALAAWFHDAVYNGTAADEEDSAYLAQRLLEGVLPPDEATEIARLIRLTATHSPASTDHAGHLLCDADLSVLGGPPDSYFRYVTSVRQDYAHVSASDFATGRAGVVRRLLALETLFHTPKGRDLWSRQARLNLAQELAQLNQCDESRLAP